MRSIYAILLFIPLAVSGQSKPIERLAPYFPTPEVVVEKMLELGGLKAGEKMMDLGSGDGRIVIMAAQKCKADATGVEFDDFLFRQSMDRIKSLGLSARARIIRGDVMRQDYSSADLVTVYLSLAANDQLTPILEKSLKKGARVVSHDFEFLSWKPQKIESFNDEERRTHQLYLYVR